MAKIGTVQEVAINTLTPYKNNAKQHTRAQVEKIAESIKEFGFLSPVLIDRAGNIIAGHGRIMAAQALGLVKVPAVYVEGLTDAQRRAYILADNRLGELASWDEVAVLDELQALQNLNFDIELTGFSLPEDTANGSWFTTRERNDTSGQDGNEEYNSFIEKFEQKKTTDDCYTPDLVFDAVAEWVEHEYGVKRSDFVRPFYPGGDYTDLKQYPAGAVVVDNPPFSILSEILKYYTAQNIRFFLFAPTLTLFSSGRDLPICYIAVQASVTYENGARVNTSFITNLDPHRVRTAPSLYAAVDKADRESSAKPQLPKYEYPAEVLTSTRAGRWSKYGLDIRITPAELQRINELDAQKEHGKEIFGSGFITSDRVAADTAAADKYCDETELNEIREQREQLHHVWELSERERGIVDRLNAAGGAQNGR